MAALVIVMSAEFVLYIFPVFPGSQQEIVITKDPEYKAVEVLKFRLRLDTDELIPNPEKLIVFEFREQLAEETTAPLTEREQLETVEREKAEVKARDRSKFVETVPTELRANEY